jgi:transcription elongation factor GreA
VAEERVALTREGLEKLREELGTLRDVRRPEVALALEQARESNLSTESEPGYELAKEEQSIVERRIALLEDMIARAEIIDEGAASASDHVQLGSTVVVSSDNGPDQTVRIVSSVEVDVAHGKISEDSPVGRALLGHRVGDVVEVAVPAGVRRLKIMSLA